MERSEVYKAIDTEREYQDRETANPERPDMVADFGMGQAMFAVQAIMSQLNQVWYKDNPDMQQTMHYVRKIAGVCVQMGEKYGMPERERSVDEVSKAAQRYRDRWNQAHIQPPE